MHTYRIEAFEYNSTQTSASAVASITRYADNIEDARMIWNELYNLRQENGNRKYQVKLCGLSYKLITNASNFFAMFEA